MLNHARMRSLHQALRYFVAAPILSLSQEDSYLFALQPGNAPIAVQSSRRRRKMREGILKAIKPNAVETKAYTSNRDKKINRK
jgi:hypothetical protein